MIQRFGQCFEDGFHDVVRHADNFLDGFLPTRTKVRNASFTDSEVRNILATSGESTTTLLPSAYRLAYFPRTPLLKSYSSSISGRLSRLVFFMSFLDPACVFLRIRISAQPHRPWRGHSRADFRGQANDQNGELLPFQGSPPSAYLAAAMACSASWGSWTRIK